MKKEIALTPNRILNAAEAVWHRYGLTKATVVDVARFLEVSPSSIYLHFPSKAALRDAVAEHGCIGFQCLWLRSHKKRVPLLSGYTDGLSDS